MSYTPKTWQTGDTITATAMNNIEQGIANAGGSPWDAVIRLTHAANSGADTTVNLTPSIVSGSFADLSEKILNDGYPCILVEYYHLSWGFRYSAPMGYVSFAGANAIEVDIAGYSLVDENFIVFGRLVWSNNDTIAWD